MYGKEHEWQWMHTSIILNFVAFKSDSYQGQFLRRGVLTVSCVTFSLLIAFGILMKVVSLIKEKNGMDGK